MTGIDPFDLTTGRRTGAEFAAGTTSLHGGSVTTDNADDDFTPPDIDGAPVGTASQVHDSFQVLITATIDTYPRPW